MAKEIDPFAGFKPAKATYNNLKFGKVGDWFRGTLTENTRQMVNNLSAKKEMQTVFEFKAQGGLFHNIENKVVAEQPTICHPGEFWSFITGKPAQLSVLKNAKLGQIVGLRFAEVKPAKTKGHNDAHIIDIYLMDMDASYQGETSRDS